MPSSFRLNDRRFSPATLRNVWFEVVVYEAEEPDTNMRASFGMWGQGVCGIGSLAGRNGPNSSVSENTFWWPMATRISATRTHTATLDHIAASILFLLIRKTGKPITIGRTYGRIRIAYSQLLVIGANYTKRPQGKATRRPVTRGFLLRCVSNGPGIPSTYSYPQPSCYHQVRAGQNPPWTASS